MIDNFRDPNNKYMKIEHVLGMKIPYLSPLELTISPHFQDDVNRGPVQETRLLYYAGTEKGERYDTLQYHEKVIKGKPGNIEQGIMLPLIDQIKILKRD